MSDRDEVEALKRAVDLVGVIRDSGVSLEAASNGSLKGLCPLHAEETPSLVVTPARQLWHCFGCDQGGDVLNFLQLKQSLSFPDAVARLRALAGNVAIGSRPKVGERSEKARTGNDLLPGGFTRAELLKRVVEFYHDTYQKARGPQHYLASRGLGGGDLPSAFRLGFCDGSFHKTVPAQGEVRDALTELGILTAKGKELFLGCIVVPLEHPDAGYVGLYGRRITQSEIKHLYLPGPQRGVFNWHALKLGDAVYVAESVLDALSAWAAGMRNVTCLYGVKSLPVDLDELLTRYAVREVRFCLDADSAGQAATERLGRELSGRGIHCLTARLPDGHDPNSLLAAEGPLSLKAALDDLVTLEAPTLAAVETEHTEDGFVLRIADVTYHVSPRSGPQGLKATVRASCDGEVVLDTVNLNAHRSRAALVNQVVARWQLPKGEVERHLLAIADAAKTWEQEEKKPTTPNPMALERKKAPELSEAEREAALAFLTHPDLVAAILADMETLGYVGEEKGKLLVYLIAVSRKLPHPLSGIILSQSGAGKSSLVELAELLVPPEDVEMYSRLSGQALVWMPQDYLRHKLLIIEERVGGVQADYSIRTLQSKQRYTQAVAMKDPVSGALVSQYKEIEGPIAYLETTTSHDIDPENATRCFELTLDESEAQTQRIQTQQRRSRGLDGLRQKRQHEALCARHHNAQRMLATLGVHVPYEHLLTFPSRWTRTRRDNNRFLSLVEAIAFLHQHQRPRTVIPADEFGPEAVYVQATRADYRIAFDLARDVLGATLHELPRHARELWDEIRALVSRRAGKKPRAEVLFTRRELRNDTNWPDRRLRDGLAQLVDMEYLAAVTGSQGKTFQYRLQFDGEVGPSPLSQLTTPEALERLWQDEAGDAH